MSETAESIADIELNDTNIANDFEDHRPVNVLVVSQGCEVLESGNITAMDHPVHILAVDDDYIITKLKDGDIGTTNNSSILNLSDSISGNIASCNNEVLNMEPMPKRKKLNDEKNLTNDLLKKILTAVQQSILQRLESIEKKVENVNSRCQYLEEKVENVMCQIKETSFNNQFNLPSAKKRTGTVIIKLPSSGQIGLDSEEAQRNHVKVLNNKIYKLLYTDNPSRNTASPTIGSNVQLITLNSAADYPNGSWLGDPDNPEMRVRCHIVPADLESINKSCPTPEKLALTLLDYLFDRATQACSNISGTGKHGKKQLDPLKIYGIRCHLIYKFNVTEKNWHKIKQNLDSKCRTAFRRKQKGMPLTVKAFRDRLPPTYVHLMPSNEIGLSPMSPSSVLTSNDNQDLHSGELGTDQSVDLNHSMPIAISHSDDSSISLPLQNIIGEPQIIHTEHGKILQVVHATPEQIAQMQQSHQVRILSATEILKELPDPTPLDPS